MSRSCKKTFSIYRGITVSALRFMLLFLFAATICAIFANNAPSAGLYFDKTIVGISYIKQVGFWRFALDYSAVFAITSISALTFFCPLALYALSAVCGISFGLCIGIIFKVLTDYSFLVIAFYMVLPIIIFAVPLSFWSACFLNVNKQCIFATRSSKASGKVFISPIIKKWWRLSLSMLATSIIFSIIVYALICFSF